MLQPGSELLACFCKENIVSQKNHLTYLEHLASTIHKYLSFKSTSVRFQKMLLITSVRFQKMLLNTSKLLGETCLLNGGGWKWQEA